MLEPPDISHESIIVSLKAEYELTINQVDFLPLGADCHSAVYRAVDEDGNHYFVKLRRSDVNEISLILPKYLSDQGIGHILAPWETKIGRLWADLTGFKLILYKFIDGWNGYEVGLSEIELSDFGKILSRIHQTVLPSSIVQGLPIEDFTPHWREMVKTVLERVVKGSFDDPLAVKTVNFLKARRDEIFNLIDRTDRLTRKLKTQPRELVLCHGDLHAGNLLIASKGGFYILDWDDLILAPRECDLMAIGGGLLGDWLTLQEEQNLFYRGYGQVKNDPLALAYYRYERIIKDIAVFSERIISAHESEKDREQSYYYMASNFQPGGVLEIAYRTDKTLDE